MTVLILLGISVRVIEGEEKACIALNEICAHNSSVIQESYYGYSDYIELYNYGSESLPLKGYGLSDKRSAEALFVFGECELAPHSYILVFATGEVPETDEKIFAPFRISDKDSIYLTDPKGKIVDSVKMEFTKSDIVYAREEDGTGKWTTMKGSPYVSNNEARRMLVPYGVEQPVFSVESGFYEKAFKLELSAADGDKIYYTLDGSLPSQNSKRYEKTIWIEDASTQENRYRNRTDFSTAEYDIPQEKVDKAVVVRAIAVDSEGKSSAVHTETYFVGGQFTEQYKGRDVVAVTADPEDLFGDKGIYVLGKINEDYRQKMEEGGEELAIEPANYMMTGKEWEREASVQIFDEKRQPTLKQEVGLRINGASTRVGATKSLRIYARERYDGNDRLAYEAFGTEREPKSLLLRSRFGKNQWLQELVEGRKVATQKYRPCVLFLNGEYWGEYCIQERVSEEYLENCYGIPAEQIILVKNGSPVIDELDEQYMPCEQEYLEFLEMIRQWYESGEDCYESADQVMDVQSYIDYMCIQIYLNNYDFSDRKNVAIWKTMDQVGQSYGDGRWRWILYDLDLTLGDPSVNTFTEPMEWMDYTISKDPLFTVLMRNEDFRRQFINTLTELAERDLSCESVEKLFIELEAKYGITLSEQEREFFTKRPKYILEYAEEQMKQAEE